MTPENLTRPTVEAMDAVLGSPTQVLDHGFVRVVDYMGDESAIVQAARVSYGKGTKSSSDDRGLIRYMMSHRHTSPFEMCELKLHVKLPIFVARQWIRHRTASVNEYSARYSILDREFYVPEAKDIQLQDTKNKQGRDGDFDPETSAMIQTMLRGGADTAFDLYDTLSKPPSKGGLGVARELARIGVPVSTYTQWYWKVDLHNLLHFLKLRVDSHAQFEIRAYAEVIARVVKSWVPNVWEAFEDYVLYAHTFSRQEMDQIRGIFARHPNETFWYDEKMSAREKDEFVKALRKPEA